MKILGYDCEIVDYSTLLYNRWYIFLKDNTSKNRLKIAKHCGIPISLVGCMYWQTLLQHLHFKYYLNIYENWSVNLPVFTSKQEAERFILLVNSQFLIDIK